MPYKDPEARREYNKRRYAANREADNARSREWRQNNRGRRTEYRRKYERTFRAANLDEARAKERARYWADPEKALARINTWRHGPGYVMWFAATWEAQQGLCYLCGEPMARENAVIEHDHACCPTHRSCAFSRRGIACHGCNVIIGGVRDDPDLLEKIARNFRPVLATTRARIASKPTQLELGT